MGGKILLNGKEYMGGKTAPYKEVTLSEYNALPASKLNDGMAYYIRDVGSPMSFPPVIYSKEEREIGVWLDGKPLYQKSIITTKLPNNSMEHIPHGVSNIDKIVHIEGFLHAKLSVDPANSFTSIPRIQDGNSGNANMAMDITVTDIVLKGRVTQATFSDIYEYAVVTFQYTKTTDIAGQGIWTTKGGLAHHYSISEQVVGTWIDGRTIYEKTVVIPPSSTTVTNNIRTIPVPDTDSGESLFKIIYAYAVDSVYGTINFGLDAYVSNSNMDRRFGFCKWYGNYLAMFTYNPSYWSQLGDITVTYQYFKNS